MATKTITTEAIALTEKKMDMTLDEIIKMSKNKPSKGRQSMRQPNKGRGFQNGPASQANNKVQRCMDSRSSARQGVLAQRRSNFQGNQFQVTKEIARKAAVVPIRSRAPRWNNSRKGATTALSKPRGGSFGTKDVVASKQRPQTLDARFANMKVQRMKVVPQQAWHANVQPIAQRHNAQMQYRGRVGASTRRFNQFGNYIRR